MQEGTFQHMLTLETGILLLLIRFFMDIDDLMNNEIHVSTAVVAVVKNPAVTFL